ncbi:MAG: hypothetical protein AAGF55_02885 [Pseudomonadota bacterium]
MPLQNRVLATGDIVATPERGTFMGNRGILHGQEQTLSKARWRHKAWIICVLHWKDWHRNVMTPGRYTELFFLDEAVALAAGHRPCALCRRAPYVAYREAAGFAGSAKDMDAVLHAERAVPRRYAQRRTEAEAATLPDGAIILLETGPGLLFGDACFPVSAKGYGTPVPRPVGQVTLLTPPRSCDALRNGFTPEFHPSLLAG